MTAEMKEIFELVRKYKDEAPRRVPHYYRRGGQLVRRSYDDFVYSTRYYELREEIASHRCFRCADCGRMCSYFNLEAWTCDFDDPEEGIICSECYEDEMGEDL